MQKLFSIRFIVGLFLVGFLTGCGYEPLQIKSINNVNYNNNGDKGKEITANITFLNPNRANFFVDSLDIDVMLGDKVLGKLQAPNLFKVSRKSEFSTDFVVIITPEALIKCGFALLKGAAVGKIELTLLGKIQIKYGIFDREIPIHHVETVKLK